MSAAIALTLVLLNAQTASAPPPAGAHESPWVVRIVSAEAIKSGTPNAPEVNPGQSVLKITVKFQYTGPEGEVPAPVLKVTDSAREEYIMLGRFQSTEVLSEKCVIWIMSASDVRFGEKPKTLASKSIPGCNDVLSFYFVIPENAKQPLALVFADAKPIPVSLK